MRAGPCGLAAAFCAVLAAALVISGVAASSGGDPSIFRRNAAFAEGDGLAGFEFDSFLARQASDSCLEFPDYTHSVLFINNSAEDTVSGRFYPEAGLSVDDYDFVSVSTNDFVLVPADANVLNEEIEVEGQLAYNISIDFNFNKCAGITIYTMNVVRKSDGSTYCSAVFDYLVAGFCIYTDDGTTKTVYTGKEGEDVWSRNFNSLIENPEITFNTFFQFLDRSNSSSPLPANPSISGIDPEFSGRTQLIRYNSESCDQAGGAYNGSSVTTDAGCHQQFSTNQPGDTWPGVFYGVRFTQYIAGRITIVYVWESFTVGSEFEGSDEEPYMTFLTLAVTGNPPPVVIRIEPDIAFQTIGGEKVTVYYLNTYNAQSRELTVDTVGPYEPDVVIENSEEIQIQNFTVAPGTGINLPWTSVITTEGGARIEAIDLTDPPYLFDYFGLRPLDPTVGPEAGGIDVTACAFSIENYDLDRDSILFGGTPVPAEFMVNAPVEFCITFVLPPRFRIDDPFVYNVSVVVDGERTFLDQFTYIPEAITVQIIPSGPSQDPNNDTIWNLPPCVPSSYSAVITPGFVNTDDLQLRWRVIDAETGTLVPLPDDGANTISFDGFDLEAGRDYIMILEATFVVGGVTRSGTDSIVIRKGTTPGLGVDVLPVVERGVTDPNQPLRVFVRVFFPEGDQCPFSINSTALEFRWTYNGVVAPVFSANSTQLDTSGRTPTKLGREYVVETPQLFMGSNDVSCLVTLMEDPSIQGSDTEVVTIESMDLVAVLNGGISEMVHFNSGDLTLSGEQSWDPNVAAAGEQRDGIQYAFTCLKSSTRNSFTEACASNVDQGASSNAAFTIPTNRFGAILTGADQIFMQITLTATKGSVTGTTTMIVDLRDNSNSQPAGVSVIVGDQTFSRYMLDDVPFYRNVQILPSSSTPGATVSYDIVSPSFETDIGKFASQISGYWFPDNEQDSVATLPLMIPDNVLLPDLTYIFKVTFSAPNTTPKETYVRFRTISEPQVVLLDMPVTSGTNETLFTARAITTVDMGDTYKYYFYLVSSSGRELCVDGCMGQSTASFYIPFAGTYRLRVELRDALGYHLASSDLSSELTVTAEGAGSLRYETFLALFLAGNSNQYEMNAYFLGALYAPDEVNDEEVVAQVADVVRGIVRIVSLSIPQSEAGSNYCSIAARVLALPTTTLTDLNTVYGAWQVFLEVMSNTPSTEQLLILDQGEAAMNYSRKHVFSAGASGTSRQRLVRQGVNGAMLDYYELTPRILTTATTRGSICGTQQRASTAVEGGDPNSGDSLGSNAVDITTATSCFAGQVQQITAASGSTYSWCQDVYDAAQVGRRHFSLMESDDLVFESGVAGSDPSNMTQGVRLVQSNVWVEDNGVVGLKPEIDYDKECYLMDIPIVAGAVRPGPNILIPPKQYGQGNSVDVFGAYLANKAVITSSNANENRVAFGAEVPGVVSIRQLGPGATTAPPLPTATPTPVDGNPGGGGLSGGAIAGIVVGILIFIVIAVVVSWLIASRCLLVTATPPPPLELDETFVERDVYGRSMWANEMGMNSAMA